MKIRASALSVLIFLMVFNSTAQTANNIRVTGRVEEGTTREPIAFAQITIEGQDTTYLAVSDTTGRFSINNLKVGKYLLNASSLGYQTKTIPLNLDNSPTHNLGIIYCRRDTTLLATVTVKASRKLYKLYSDKIVYDIASDSLIQSKSAFDALLYAPLITVDEGNNILMGQKPIIVLINGKQHVFSNKTPQELLKAFPADELKSVELMFLPQGKYGENVGVINIITRKERIRGYLGNLTFDISPRAGSNYGYFALAKGRWSAKLNTRYYNIFGEFSKLFATKEFASSSGNYQNLSSQIGDASPLERYGSGLLEIGYQIDTSSSLGLFISGDIRNSELDKYINYTYNTPDSSVNIIHTNGKRTGENKATDLGLEYYKAFNNGKSELWISGRKKNASSSFQLINTATLISDEQSQEIRNNKLNESEYLFQVDFLRKHKTGNIGIGYKLADRNHESFSDLKRSNTLISEENTLYDQLVNQIYLRYLYQAKNWNLRIKTTFDWFKWDARFIANSPGLEKVYFNFLPSITLSKTVGNNNRVSVGYERSATRPSVEYINPNVNDSDPLNLRYGNPNLKPEISNTVRLGYQMVLDKLWADLSLIYGWGNNFIGEYSKLDSTSGVFSHTFENINNYHRTTASLSISYRPISKLRLSLTPIVSYTTLQDKNENQFIENSKFRFFTFFRGRYAINKDWNTSIRIGYRSPMVLLQGRTNEMLTYSVEISKTILKGKGSIELDMKNPFGKYLKLGNSIKEGNILQTTINKVRGRIIGIGFSYRFGKLEEKESKRKRVENTDLKQKEE